MPTMLAKETAGVPRRSANAARAWPQVILATEDFGTGDPDPAPNNDPATATDPAIVAFKATLRRWGRGKHLKPMFVFNDLCTVTSATYRF